MELNKRFLEAYIQFKGEPRVQELCSKVLRYNRILRDLGIRDHQARIDMVSVGIRIWY